MSEQNSSGTVRRRGLLLGLAGAVGLAVLVGRTKGDTAADPHFRNTQWVVPSFIQKGEQDWVQYSGDELAIPGQPDTWKTLGALLVNKADFDAQTAAYAANGQRVVPAVAFALGDEARVGIAPAGAEPQFFGTSPDDRDYVVGMKIGPGKLVATMGHYSAEGVFTSHATTGLPGSLTTEEFVAQYPDGIWV